jgi:hypothetical protein
MRLRLLAFAVVTVLAATGCGDPPPKLRCVVKVFRPDGTLHREYRGTVNTFILDGARLPAIHNARGGAAYVVLNERVVDAAAGWQIEVEREAEKEEGR